MKVTPDNFSEVLNQLSQAKVLACDTETTGLDESDVPFALIIADKEESFYFDERYHPGFWDQPLLKWLFEHDKITWLFQNAKFDMRMLRQKNIEVAGPIVDIAIAARLNRNDHFGGRAYSLAAQAKRHGWAKDDRVEKYIKEQGLYEVRKNFFGEEYKQPCFDKVPVGIMEQYATQDARLTYDLFYKYAPHFDEGDRRVMTNESDLTKVCFKMERTGLLLNKDYTLKAMYYEKDLLSRARIEYQGTTGATFVNSAKSIGPHLDGFTLPLTEDGNPSLTDDVLEDIIVNGTDKAKHVATLVQTIRGYEKRITTYYESYLNKADRFNIVHPTMWQAGTRTGRFSYSDPNLQNIPKEDSEEDLKKQFVIRGCFTPRPGNVFVSMDYSQMEYRMMAAYANEAGVIEQVMNGVDFHEATAKMFGVSRKAAKTLNFAILYGAGDAKLAYMLGISVQEARTLRLKYFMALPKVEQLVDRVIRTGKSRGYVKTWLGRKLYAESNYCYALPNHLIQGGGADVVKVAMNRIHDAYPDVLMVLQVHDQLLFDMRPDQFHLVPKIKQIMENAFPEMNGMRLLVDVSWSDKSFAERDLVKGLP